MEDDLVVIWDLEAGSRCEYCDREAIAAIRIGTRERRFCIFHLPPWVPPRSRSAGSPPPRS